MNKETVKKNLKFVFFKEEEANKAMDIGIDAQKVKNKANEVLCGARGVLRKSIEDSQEIYIISEGKSYKITPDNSDEFGMFIEEIEVIK